MATLQTLERSRLNSRWLNFYGLSTTLHLLMQLLNDSGFLRSLLAGKYILYMFINYKILTKIIIGTSTKCCRACSSSTKKLSSSLLLILLLPLESQMITNIRPTLPTVLVLLMVHILMCTSHQLISQGTEIVRDILPKTSLQSATLICGLRI